MARHITSCREYFDTIGERFLPDKAEGVDATYLFRLDGEGGGTWTLTVHDKTITATETEAASPSVTYHMKASDYVDLANGDLGGVRAVFTRKLKVSGNIALAKRMNDFLPPGK